MYSAVRLRGRRHEVSRSPIYAAGSARLRASELRWHLASRVTPAGHEPKAKPSCREGRCRCPRTRAALDSLLDFGYADAPPNRGGVPSGPTCPMAGRRTRGADIASAGLGVACAARGRVGRAGSSHGAALAALPADGGGGAHPGARHCQCRVGSCLCRSRAVGACRSSHGAALAALPADGGGGVPGVPTLPVADCPPLAPACEATPVPLEGGGGVPGVPMEPASLTPAASLRRHS